MSATNVAKDGQTDRIKEDLAIEKKKGQQPARTLVKNPRYEFSKRRRRARHALPKTNITPPSPKVLGSGTVATVKPD